MWHTGNIYAIAGIAVIGGALFGFDISSMSALITTQAYRCYFNQQGFSSEGVCLGPRPDVQGGIVASMAGGSWLGALVSGLISDFFGRKTTIQIGAVIWIIGSIITAATQNIPMLVVGRVINGFCVGICSAQVPVYIAEISPASKRGRLIGAQQWAITWGIMIMFYISYGCAATLEGTPVFRVPWGVQAVPGFALLMGMFILPESPRWLASKDRWEEAEQVLILTHGKGDPNSPIVRHEYNEIKEWIALEKEAANVSYLELIRPRMLNRTHIGLFTQIWSQLTGMNVMMYYITYVFTMAGLTANTNLVASSVQYVINVVMTVPALLFMDRWGRRPTLLVGAALMATWLFANAGILATYGTYPGPEGVDNIPEASTEVRGAASRAVIACSYLFVASYAPTWGPVSWTYPPELYPNRVRGKAVALSTSGNWAFNFALGYFVPPAFVSIRWRTYLLFGVFCVAMFVHVFFLFPETAGKPLEEVTEMFEDPNGIPYLGTPAWKTKNTWKTTRLMERTGAGLEKTISNDRESPERGQVEPKEAV
ncbi:High-affinity glucose transporter [Sphaceloma murrayae]|uniref:High-affinity glucose transporter n=1 Tax=Sphaceloma murrayae TaxID=2082308 RepID=A0A2K1QWI8_9PEZI|nr:High-affinity glucose transporter [Sphaceloma murrayae]